jgi:hypothetical protein
MAIQKAQLSQETVAKRDSARQTKMDEQNSRGVYDTPLRFPVLNGVAPPDIPLTPQISRYLQRRIGNRAVGQIIQAKLKIGQPNDKFEQEANRVAERVMRMEDHGGGEQPSISSVTPGGNIQRVCPECEEELQRQPLEEEEEEQLQRQVEEEEEETLQRQVDEEEEESLQRQPAEEEEEELLQSEPLSSQSTDLKVQRKCAECEQGGTLCPNCAAEESVQRQAEEEEEELLQGKGAPASPSSVSPQVSGNINALRGGGQPLSPANRSFFEPRFGYDLSGVQVHTGPKAAETARAVNAKAFTVGRDVVFGAGQFTPDTQSGKQLLAHELTHVVQQLPYLSRRSPESQSSPVNGRPDAAGGESPAETVELAENVTPVSAGTWAEPDEKGRVFG